MTGRCATCKHWNRALEGGESFHDSDYSPRDAGFGGLCERADGGSGEPSDETTLAYAADFERYGAVLVTKPDFGCVMWEERDG